MLNKDPERPPSPGLSVLRSPAVRANNVRSSYALFQKLRRLSRADLARLTGLTRATTSQIVDTLVRARVIRPIGFFQPMAGRPAELLEFDPSGRSVLGIELSDTRCLVVVADLDGRPTRVLDGPGAPDAPTALERAETLLRSALTELEPASVIGIGAGVPGVVDPRSGEIEVAPDLGWQSVSVGKTLSDALGLPVLVANRAKTAGLAEYWCGAARGCQRLVFVSVGSGIAAGIVLDGQLYRGATSHEGELGHVTVVTDGDRCACGNRGCLQGVAAVPALLAAVELAHARPGWTLDDVGQAVHAGDDVVLGAISTVARHLGVATANLVNILNPQMVVFGGPLLRAVPSLVDRIRDEVRSRAVHAELTGLELSVSALGDEVVALGAATLVLSSADLVDAVLSGARPGTRAVVRA